MPLLIVHDKFPTSQEMCLSLDSTQGSASIATQLWAQKYPDINGVEGRRVLSLLSSLSFSPQLSLGTQLGAGCFWVQGGHFSWWGSYVPSSFPLFPCYILAPISISRALGQLFSGSVNLVNKAWEWEQNCSSANMSSTWVSWEGPANRLISFFLLFVCNYCTLEAAAACTRRKFRFYNF